MIPAKTAKELLYTMFGQHFVALTVSTCTGTGNDIGPQV